MKRVLITVAIAALLGACGDSQPDAVAYGADPTIPAPQRGLLPKMTIAKPAPWDDQRPTVPQGYTITAIATDLNIPRQTLVLPNGDILVAEGRGGGAAALKPKDVIAGRDPQLEKAIELMQAELKKNPPRKLKRPPYPVRTK